MCPKSVFQTVPCGVPYPARQPLLHLNVFLHPEVPPCLLPQAIYAFHPVRLLVLLFQNVKVNLCDVIPKINAVVSFYARYHAATVRALVFRIPPVKLYPSPHYDLAVFLRH